MSRPDCAAGACLPGADSVWFLLALAVVWATVAVTFAALAVRVWRERRPDAAHRFERASRQALAAAVTVAEIQRRLRREAARPVRLPRVVTVVPRLRASPQPFPEAGPASAAFAPIGHQDDD